VDEDELECLAGALGVFTEDDEVSPDFTSPATAGIM
jgi:hypothetical protein